MIFLGIQVYQADESEIQFINNASIDLIVVFWFAVCSYSFVALERMILSSFGARARQLWRFTSKDQQQENTKHTANRINFIVQFQKVHLLRHG